MAVAVGLPLYQPQRAEAWSNAQLPKCSISGTNLDWAWRTTIENTTAWKTAGSATVGKTIEDFDSVIMWRNAGGTTTFLSVGGTDLGPSGYVNQFHKNPSTGKYYFNQKVASSDGTIYSNTKTLYGWTNGSTSLTTTFTHLQASNTEKVPSDANQGTSNDIGCIEFAKGFQYPSDYDGYLYSEVIPDESGVCSGLDLVCRIGSVFQGVADTFIGVGQAILRGLALLWIPSGDEIKTDIDSLSTFMSNKLGFLVYPVTFFGDLFDAMDGSGTWCNTTTCELSATSGLGGTVKLDLLGLSHHGGADLWNWFLLFIRGTTVVGLLIMLNNRLREVLQR
jgi:hypothetical protein